MNTETKRPCPQCASYEQSLLDRSAEMERQRDMLLAACKFTVDVMIARKKCGHPLTQGDVMAAGMLGAAIAEVEGSAK